MSQRNKASEITAPTVLSFFSIYYAFNLGSSYKGADLTLQSLLSLICSVIEMLCNRNNDSGPLAELLLEGKADLTS